MAKYMIEAKPPLTRSDLFADGWEQQTFHADSDENAIARMDKLVERHDVGKPLTIRLSCEGKLVKQYKSMAR